MLAYSILKLGGMRRGAAWSSRGGVLLRWRRREVYHGVGHPLVVDVPGRPPVILPGRIIIQEDPSWNINRGMHGWEPSPGQAQPSPLSKLTGKNKNVGAGVGGGGAGGGGEGDHPQLAFIAIGSNPSFPWCCSPRLESYSQSDHLKCFEPVYYDE